MNTPLLLIDDDPRLGDMLQSYLEPLGFMLKQVEEGRNGVQAALGGDYAMVLLDIMLPDIDGYEVCRRIRQESSIPILMLTGRGDDTDRIVGLEIGADDYLPKPFNPRELVARLKAILRRSQGSDAGLGDKGPEILVFGQLSLDNARRQAVVDGKVCELTEHQFSLLWLLAKRRGRVQSREALMEGSKGQELEAFDRSIDVHISRIRAAIEKDPKNPTLIKTIRGVGYVFTGDGQAPSA